MGGLGSGPSQLALARVLVPEHQRPFCALPGKQGLMLRPGGGEHRLSRVGFRSCPGREASGSRSPGGWTQPSSASAELAGPGLRSPLCWSACCWRGSFEGFRACLVGLRAGVFWRGSLGPCPLPVGRGPRGRRIHRLRAPHPQLLRRVSPSAHTALCVAHTFFKPLEIQDPCLQSPPLPPNSQICKRGPREVENIRL